MIGKTGLAGLCLALISGLPAAAEPAGAQHGMVVTTEHLASDVGVAVLRQGGNAVDAAVAVGYALAVVDPCCGNLGGGGFLTLRLKDGKTAFLDFRERAPLKASPTMYQDASGKIVPKASLEGYLAVAVPGSVMGLEVARERWGTWPRARLMAPAIALAEKGFVLGPGDIGRLREREDAMRRDPAAAAIFLKPGGQSYQVGDRLVQAALARSLRTISEGGSAVFYGGALGDKILAASASHGGILQKADLLRYTARSEAPVRCNYRGYEVISSPPPSSGGTTICEILNILEGYPLGKWGFHSPESARALIEAMRHAYTDRNTLLGDPRFVDNPVARLTSKSYAAAIRAKIDATPAAVGLGGIDGAKESHETTHYSIIDDAGDAVAVTYTLDAPFGAAVVAGDTGILLNDEMDDFSAKPGSANIAGLVTGRANAIAPGKTPLSSMAPSILTKDGHLFMVVGALGGPTIITSVLQAIVNVIDYGMPIDRAIDAPRLHDQAQPDVVFAEPGALSPATLQVLQRLGYTVSERPSFGRAGGILVGGPALGVKPKDPALRYFGAQDDRREGGSAAGY